MPLTEILLFREWDGSIPLLDWLDRLEEAAREKCLERLERLRALGFELRRPEAENLGSGIYELRVKHRRVNPRMLFFFDSRGVAVVTQGFTKQRATVPPIEIRRAQRRRQDYEASPLLHSLRGEQ